MKKILSLIMVIVLALCLGGCGQDTIPKADYAFTTKEFLLDCFLKHGTDIDESLLKAENFYYNKRIELKGVVSHNSEKYKFAALLGLGRESDEAATYIYVKFKNDADRNKFLEKEYVKLSARFRGTRNGEIEGKFVVIFDFDDGIFLKKL